MQIADDSSADSMESSLADVSYSSCQPRAVRTLGAILLDSNILNLNQIEQILQAQADDPALRFGDAAIKLKLVDPTQVRWALARQFVYPYLLRGESATSSEVVAAYDPFSSGVEKLRALRNQLLARWFHHEDCKAIAILSEQASEGKTFLAANCAVVFSQLGHRTLLVDASLRSPGQHRMFGLANKYGLSTLLVQRSSMRDSVEKIRGLTNLSVISAGPQPPNPNELLSSRSFQELAKFWQERYDAVIFDTGSTESSNDAYSVAAMAKGGLLVTRRNRTGLRPLKATAQRLKVSGVQLLGAVLNDF